MPVFPILSGRETARAFESLGWKIARQKGSHIIMVKDGQLQRCPCLIIRK